MQYKYVFIKGEKKKYFEDFSDLIKYIEFVVALEPDIDFTAFDLINNRTVIKH